MTKLHDVILPDEAAGFVASQVTAGRFRSIDDALEAGLAALQERDEYREEWLALARRRIEEGRAAYARGGTIETTPDEFMDGIEAELGLTR